jgi:hypothetical protein
VAPFAFASARSTVSTTPLLAPDSASRIALGERRERPVLEGLPADARDHVAALEPGLRRRTVGVEQLDEQPIGPAVRGRIVLHADLTRAGALFRRSPLGIAHFRAENAKVVEVETPHARGAAVARPPRPVGGCGRSALADGAVRREPDHERRDDQRRRSQPPTGLSMEARCHVWISALVLGRAS